MRIVITGGTGFLGARLATALLAEDLVAVGGQRAPLTQLRVLDLVAPADPAPDPRVEYRIGDLQDLVEQGALDDADAVVHLAAAVSAAAEADFDLGMRANVDTTRALLDRLRRNGRQPVVVFASSLAVFGADDGPIPSPVTDEARPAPQSSYGIQKLIGEHLMTDYTRRGYIRGRVVRLMTVAVRPGRPNSAASAFVSGIIREPAAGQPADCPVPPDTEIAIASPASTIGGLKRALEASEAEWRWTTAVLLPAITVTPRQIAETLDRLLPTTPSALIRWSEDQRVAGIVSSWPARFVTDRAAELGLMPDAGLEEIIRAHLAETGMA